MAKILVCDHVAIMRTMIKEILIKEGHQISGEATNGIEAIDKFKENKPELVIIEFTMPEMDGANVIKELKSMDPAIPILVCSTNGEQDGVIKSYMAGAVDFVVKPIKKERLIQAVNKALVNDEVVQEDQLVSSSAE